MRIGDIVARLAGDGHNRREILQNLLFLVASGNLMPFAQAGGLVDTGGRGAASPAVAAALASHTGDETPTFVPCGTLGSGIAVSEDEAIRALRWMAGEEIERPARLARLGILRGA